MCPKIVGSTGGAYDALLGFLVRKLRTSRMSPVAVSRPINMVTSMRQDQIRGITTEWIGWKMCISLLPDGILRLILTIDNHSSVLRHTTMKIVHSDMHAHLLLLVCVSLTIIART